jgi:Fe/S biogenesis protein NfuA
MITFKDAAIARISAAVNQEGKEGQCFRVSISGLDSKGYRYDFSLDEEKYILEDDVVVEQGGFKTIIDAKSAEKLNGASIDWAEGDMGNGGFAVENPNSPKLDANDPGAQKVQELFDQEVNPALASHGGFVELIDLKDNRLFIKLGGGCQGCGGVDMTLKHGIEVLVKENIPAIEEVIDTTDHADGKNPYYSG